MPTTLVFKFLAAVIFNFVISVHTLEVDLTVDVKPGHEECFYEEIKKPTSFEIEYQVGKGQILALDDYLLNPHTRPKMFDGCLVISILVCLHAATICKHNI